jgi:hypothetical protein
MLETRRDKLTIRCRKQTVQHKYTSDDDEQGLAIAVLKAIGESLLRVVNEKPAYHRFKGSVGTLA